MSDRFADLSQIISISFTSTSDFPFDLLLACLIKSLIDDVPIAVKHASTPSVKGVTTSMTGQHAAAQTGGAALVAYAIYRMVNAKQHIDYLCNRIDKAKE